MGDYFCRYLKNIYSIKVLNWIKDIIVNFIYCFGMNYEYVCYKFIYNIYVVWYKIVFMVGLD